MTDEKHRPLVVSGPSGSGKSTLLNRLFAEFPDTFGFSVSHTTRSPRPGEEDGKQYHFVDRETFQRMIDSNQFIEHAEFSGNLYGTSISAIKQVADAKKVAVLDVDMQGVKSVKKSDLKARFLFIKPPSTDILEQRLRNRGTESDDAIKERLATAKAELEYADHPGSHDLVIVNDSLDEAYNKLRAYVVEITSTTPLVAAGETADANGNAVVNTAQHTGLTSPAAVPNAEGGNIDKTAKKAQEKKDKEAQKAKEADEKARKEKEKADEKAKKEKEKADEKARKEKEKEEEKAKKEKENAEEKQKKEKEKAEKAAAKKAKKGDGSAVASPTSAGATSAPVPPAVPATTAAAGDAAAPPPIDTTGAAASASTAQPAAAAAPISATPSSKSNKKSKACTIL